jgi:hypothetical protein
VPKRSRNGTPKLLFSAGRFSRFEACGNHIVSTRATLRREADAAQQLAEAWVGAQGVEQRIHPAPDEKFRIALLIGLFQKGEGLILFPQSRIDGGEVAPGDIPSF